MRAPSKPFWRGHYKGIPWCSQMFGDLDCIEGCAVQTDAGTRNEVRGEVPDDGLDHFVELGDFIMQFQISSGE